MAAWDRAVPAVPVRAGTENGMDPDESTVVRTAAEAAEGLVFSRFRKSAVRDIDVTVSFEDGVLEVDVYLNVPDPGDRDPDPDRVADDAALAARSAVDELFEGRD